eukprot:GCRY01000407.1.p1 GENE.GCRY01000407.1~~GCRY01000407.1.p1  ORF type:complete len:466 (+),score=103.74 GCRY01000407.1:173-1570(+)
MVAKITVSLDDFHNVTTPAFILLLTEEQFEKGQTHERKGMSFADCLRVNYIESILHSTSLKSDFQGKFGQVVSLYAPSQCPGERVIVVGLGSVPTLKAIRKGAELGMKKVREFGIDSCAFGFRGYEKELKREDVVSAISSAVAFSDYLAFTKSKGLNSVTICIGDCKDIEKQGQLQLVANEELVIGNGATLMKDYVNEGVEVPFFLEACNNLAFSSTLVSISVLDFEAEGLRSIYQFGHVLQKPKLVMLTYEGDKNTDEATCLVANGPGSHCSCGGSLILAVLSSAVKAKLKANITAFITIGSYECKQNTVFSTLNGTTIHSSKDKEGLLLLAAAIEHASHKVLPCRLISLGCHSSTTDTLGSSYGGLFCTNDKLKADLIAASENTQEPLCALPLNEDYLPLITSSVADYSTINCKTAASTALFLSLFAKDLIPNAYIEMKDASFKDATATAYGLRLIMKIVANK